MCKGTNDYILKWRNLVKVTLQQTGFYLKVLRFDEGHLAYRKGNIREKSIHW